MHSKGVGRSYGHPLCFWQEGKILRASAVGILARELSAYEFASEQYVLEYTAQIAPLSAGRHHAPRAPGAGELPDKTTRKAATLNVPADYRSVQDALDAAEDGDVVRLAPGRYKEALVISKRVLLFGAGKKAGDTVLEAPDESVFFAGAALSTLVLEASEAKICNVSIIGGGVSVPVIENMCGDLTLEGCDIRGGSCGLKVQDSAGAILKFCDVRDSAEHGVYVSKQGWASIDKSHVFDCKCGVLVGQLGSQCSLRGTDVSNCSQV